MPYFVWSEEGQEISLWADGKMMMQVLRGTIDYFTPQEFDPVMEAAQNALCAAGVPFRLNSIQRETDTGIIHYEWVWEHG